MKRIPMKKTLLAVAVLGLLAAVAAPGVLLAQSQTETKIRLMAEGLRARDAGDFATAQRTFEELLAIAPGDANVRRLLDEVKSAHAAGATTAAPRTITATAAAPANVPPPVQVAPPPEPRRRIFGGRAPEAPLPDALAGPVESLSAAEEARLRQAMDQARGMRRDARSLSRAGQYDEALAVLDRALASLPRNPLTSGVIDDLESERNDVLVDKSRALLREGETIAAREVLATYEELNPDSRGARRLESRIVRAEADPVVQPIRQANPQFVRERAEIAQMVAKGRSQFLAGDLDGAADTFRRVEAADPDNAEAKIFLQRIAQQRGTIGVINREKTRAQLLEEVAKAWQRPGLYEERVQDVTAPSAVAPLMAKLNAITIPSVNFSGVDLSRVISTLSAVSEEYDNTGTTPRGVNIVLLDPTNANPSVNITLRNLSLKRVLDFISDAVGYQYEVQADAVIFRPGGERSLLDTAVFPVSRATVIRMTGVGATGAVTPGAPAVDDPFAPVGAPAGGGGGGGGESGALRAFLQQAGVNFDGVAGSALVYDGSAMIVTQSARNIERIRNILNRYNDVRQVEIEAKFMEVQEGALEELGVNWLVTRRPGRGPGGSPGETYRSSIRSLQQAFTGSQNASAIIINGEEVASVVAPNLPGTVQLGAGAAALANITGVIGEFDVSATVRALSQRLGSDLLSAPKITVLSGNPANITVAQELRYPQAFGDIQSQVGQGTATPGGGIVGGGVTITAGTPQDFVSRNVGVELRVTPTVEEDDYSISLDLNPRVTEFEGFVEYGGPSVAIQGGTTVTVPSGFFQPIFSVREVTTKVTIWDGATIVMGGLTREEVKKVNDKVPVLGNVPVVGRLFRSEGESSTKRNLLIFVTANLVSPGGSPKNQSLRNVDPSSVFQNPTLVTPSGSEPRGGGVGAGQR
jgi:general secretion pathway protein D